MTALTVRQRTKINTVLSAIHLAGQDVAAIQKQAETLRASGQSPAEAYEAAVGDFIASNPAFAPSANRLAALIDASDDATVTRYDTALSTFIRTGDEGALQAIEATVRRDSVALAIRNGEISSADAVAGRIDWDSLGLSAPEPESFAFAQPPAPGPAEPAQSFVNPSHPGVPGVTTGVRAPSVAARWAKAPNLAPESRSPYEGMSPGQAREAMRADQAAPRGWIRGESEGD